MATPTSSLVKSFVEDVLNAYDTSLIPILFSRDYIDYDPPLAYVVGPPAATRRGTRSDLVRLVRLLQSTVVDVKFHLEDLICEATRIAYRLFGAGILSISDSASEVGDHATRMSLSGSIVCLESGPAISVGYSSTGIFHARDTQLVSRWGRLLVVPQ